MCMIEIRLGSSDFGIKGLQSWIAISSLVMEMNSWGEMSCLVSSEFFLK